MYALCPVNSGENTARLAHCPASSGDSHSENGFYLHVSLSNVAYHPKLGE